MRPPSYLSSLPLLSFLFFLVPVFARNAWGLSVYANAETFDLRDIDASTSSFYYDGVLSVAWRDDSLCYGPFPPGYLDGTFPYGVGRPYVDGDTYVVGNDDRVSNYSWKGGGVGSPGPAVALIQSALVGTNVPAQMSFSVTTTIPLFVETPASSSSNIGSSSSEPTCYVVGRTSTSGTYSSVQELSDFPLDSQTFELSYLNRLFDASDMPFVVTRSSEASIALMNEIEGFDVASANMSATSEIVGGVASFPKLFISFRLDRHTAFYINRFVVPLVLLHVMLAWVPLINLERQTRGVFAYYIFTSTMAFLFLYTRVIPPTPYSTRLDRFFLLCFIHCFIVHNTNVLLNFRWRRINKVVEALCATTERGSERGDEHERGKISTSASGTITTLDAHVSYYYYSLRTLVGVRRLLKATNQVMPEFKYDVVLVLASNVIFGAITASIFTK